MYEPKSSTLVLRRPFFVMIGVPVKPIAGGVGQRLAEVRAEGGGVGAVHLVDQHHDRVVGVDLSHVHPVLRRAVLVLLDHHEDDAGTAPGQVGPGSGAGLGDVHLLAAQLHGLLELVLELSAVGDGHDLVVRELRDRPHPADQEGHGEALARALGVPDDPAALARLACQQPVDSTLDRPELLVAGCHLDRRAGVDGHEGDEVVHDVEQVDRVEHAGGEDLLLAELLLGLVPARGELRHGQGVRVAPGDIVLLGGGNGAEPGVLAAGHDRQLYGVEEFRGVGGVAADLVHCFAEVALGRGLALDDHEGDAVHEQDEIGDVRLAAAGAGDVHAELVDHGEVVVRRGLPVDEVDRPVPAAVRAVHGDALDQEVGDVLVGFQEAGGGDSSQGVVRLADPGVVQPGVALVVEVDAGECVPYVISKDHFVEGVTQGRLRNPRQDRAFLGAGRMLPAHAFELFDQGTLYQRVLVVGHRPTPSVNRRTSFPRTNNRLTRACSACPGRAKDFPVRLPPPKLEPVRSTGPP